MQMSRRACLCFIVAGWARNLECVTHQGNLSVQLQRRGCILRLPQLDECKPAGDRDLCKVCTQKQNTQQCE
jgi:hypothetical protein